MRPADRSISRTWILAIRRPAATIRRPRSGATTRTARATRLWRRRSTAGFEFNFVNGAGGPSVWNAFYLNSNGSVTFGAGDADNTPTVNVFFGGPAADRRRMGRPRPERGAAASTRNFPVQAVGFAGINHFKVRWINVPGFGQEGLWLASTPSRYSLFDDGTGVDENANQAFNPANPIGNNAVAFDLQEGPTALAILDSIPIPAS